MLITCDVVELKNKSAPFYLAFVMCAPTQLREGCFCTSVCGSCQRIVDLNVSVSIQSRYWSLIQCGANDKIAESHTCEKEVCLFVQLQIFFLLSVTGTVTFKQCNPSIVLRSGERAPVLHIHMLGKRFPYNVFRMPVSAVLLESDLGTSVKPYNFI